MGSYLGTSFERQGEHKGSEAEGADGLAFTRSRGGSAVAGDLRE